MVIDAVPRVSKVARQVGWRGDTSAHPSLLSHAEPLSGLPAGHAQEKAIERKKERNPKP